MLLKYIPLLSIVFCLLSACQNTDHSTINNAENETLSPSNMAALKEKTRCFSLYNYDRQELVTVVIDQDTIYGELHGVINSEDIIIEGGLTGKCKGDTCEIQISKMYSQDYELEIMQQTWVKNSKNEFEVIKGMEYANRTAETFFYRPIRCFQFDPTAKYDLILEFKDGYAPIMQNGVMGIIDSNYNLVVEAQYNFISNINEGTVAFRPQGQMSYHYGIMDVQGNIMVEATQSQATPFYNGIAALVDDKGYYFIDKTSKIVIPPNNYKSIIFSSNYEEDTQFIREGLIPILKDDKWGFLDKKGNIVIPFIYEYVEHFQDGRATVQKDGKSIIIDRYNKCLFNCD